MNQHHYPHFSFSLSNKNTRTTSSLDLSLSFLAEELGLDDDGHVGEGAVAHELVVAVGGDVDDGRLAVLCVLGRRKHVLAHERPELLEVQRGAVLAVPEEVEPAHAHLTEVTRVILVEQDPVVVLPARVTAAARVRPVLADAPVAGAHLSALLAVLGKSGRHLWDGFWVLVRGEIEEA